MINDKLNIDYSSNMRLIDRKKTKQKNKKQNKKKQKTKNKKQKSKENQSFNFINED